MKAFNLSILLVCLLLLSSCTQQVFHRFDYTPMEVSESNLYASNQLQTYSTHSLTHIRSQIDSQSNLHHYADYLKAKAPQKSYTTRKKGRLKTAIHAIKVLRELKRNEAANLEKQKKGNVGTIVKVPKKTSGMAIAGFISSIAALLFLAIPVLAILFFPLAILSVVFSGIALKDIRSNPDILKGRGLAIAGLVIGILELSVLLLLIAILLAFSGLSGWTFE